MKDGSNLDRLWTSGNDLPEDPSISGECRDPSCSRLVISLPKREGYQEKQIRASGRPERSNARLIPLPCDLEGYLRGAAIGGRLVDDNGIEQTLASHKGDKR